MRSSLFSVASALAFALGALAGTSSTAYTDANTGITFQQYVDTTGFAFGMALPENPSTDFIGQMIAPVTEGWAGITLNGEMTGTLLIIAWPNGDEIVSSFREATGYTTPSVYSGDSTMETITKGTFVNSTHFSCTFLCKKCIVDSLTFTATESVGTLGFAFSKTAVNDPTDAESELSYHSAGYGEYGMMLSNAKSSKYATWAALASASTGGSGNSTGSTNSTTSATATASSTVSAPTATSTSNATYDYIIAGAGPAGIIVAERLAETGKTVLLIERGGASTYSTGSNDTLSWNNTLTKYDVPALAYSLLSMDDTSEYCTDTASTAGCLLGGSAMINALMFVRPQEIDFNDKWPAGWKWADVASAAERFYERNPGTSTPSADGKRYDQAGYNVLSEFFKGSGWSEVDALQNPNGKHNVYAHPPWNIKGSKRAGPVKTYLPLAQALGNFKLKLNTKVVRAVRSGSHVSGVEVETSNGQRELISIKSDGKVILAAGALSTPRILFNSGIGPADQISIVANGTTSVTLPPQNEWIDLPVGKGLKDHPIFSLKFTTSKNVQEISSSAVMSPNSSLTLPYAAGNGVLAQGGQRLNFWTSVNGTDGVRYIQGTTSVSTAGTISMMIYLTHGLTSSGVLGITSTGTTEFVTKPWLTTQADKDAITGFMETLIGYTKNSSLLTLNSSLSNPTGADLISDYVTGDHFVGSAKMGTDDGRKSNGTAVVDLDTKVYGTDNLFVVDASIHPDLPTGNTQAIIMVVAEHAAAKIIAAQVPASSDLSTGSSGTRAPYTSTIIPPMGTGDSSVGTATQYSMHYPISQSSYASTFTQISRSKRTASSALSSSLESTSTVVEATSTTVISSVFVTATSTVFQTMQSTRVETITLTKRELEPVTVTATGTGPAVVSCTVPARKRWF